MGDLKENFEEVDDETTMSQASCGRSVARYMDFRPEFKSRWIDWPPFEVGLNIKECEMSTSQKAKGKVDSTNILAVI